MVNENDMNFLEENRDCSYFETKSSDIRYRYIERCDITEYQSMLEHGWRRFGRLHFVPECKSCKECVSMRIIVDKFVFSKSHKRVFAKNKHTKIVIKKPSMTFEHLHLYDRYHAYMADKKGWHYAPIEPLEYKRSYVNGAFEFGYEFLYFIDSVLVGVALVDILPQAISSIYCYYDHNYKDLSLGKFSILTQIALAKNSKIPHVYLGYWIKDHPSMGYKEYYKPFEVLENRAELHEPTIWSQYG